jgi:hypothetical protein
MSWPRFDRVPRWVLPAAALLLAPKCVLCVLAWLGVLLGLAGPEICGGP